MKIIHTADIHLESKMNKLDAKKSRIRQLEIRDSFFNLIDYANKESVKVVLIAGDLFESKNVKIKTLKELISKFDQYPNIDFIYLNGNHDDSDVFSNEKIGILPSNLKIVKKHDTYKYDNVKISAIDIFKYQKDSYLKELKLDPKDFNILMMHGSLSEIPFNKLKGINIDYLALGDIHKPDFDLIKLDGRGYFGYSGILEPRGFDELGERGFFLLEVENNKLKRKFVKNNQRTYHVIDVDITNLDSNFLISNKINEQLKNIKNEDIIRVVLKGIYEYETIKDLNKIIHDLNQKYFYAELKDESKLDYTNIDFDKEVSLRGEFSRIVKSLDIKQEDKDKVLEFGLKALMGEEIEI